MVGKVRRFMMRRDAMWGLAAVLLLGALGNVAQASEQNVDALDAQVVARGTSVSQAVDYRVRELEQARLQAEAANAAGPDKDVWVKVDKTWGNIGSLDLHGTTMTVGYDKRFDKHNQAGVLFSYATKSYAGAGKNDELKDYRVGIYDNYHGDYKIRAFDATVYLDYGTQKHDAMRYGFASKYDSRLIEAGLNVKHDFHAHDGKIYHVSTYSHYQASHYLQKAYSEGDYHMSSTNSNYIFTEKGLEVARYLKDGSYAARLGYSHVWRGHGKTLYYNYGGQALAANSHTDRYLVTASLEGNKKLNAHGWSIEGGARLMQGPHDKAYGVSAMLTWQW